MRRRKAKDFHRKFLVAPAEAEHYPRFKHIPISDTIVRIHEIGARALKFFAKFPRACVGRVQCGRLKSVEN
jgi:hypothetical protein